MAEDLLNRRLKLLLFTAGSLHKAELDTNALLVLTNAIDMDSKLPPKYQRLFFDIVMAIVSPARSALRHLTDNFNKETKERNVALAEIIQEVILSVFMKLELTCQGILSIIDQQLIPGNPDPESKIEFMRLQGDLYRYLFEFAPQEKKELYLNRGQSVYDQAFGIASVKLMPHSQARLSLVLNRALFLANCQHKVNEAADFAENEANRLLSESVEMNEELYQKAMMFGRKLRDKVIQWRA
jgi:hypothetical protein